MKKKLVLSIVSAVLAAVLIVAVVMSCHSGQPVIGPGGSSLSDDTGSSVSTDSGMNSDGGSNGDSGNNQNKPIDSSVSTPQTNTQTDDGLHVNDLNNTGKKATLKNNCYSTGYPLSLIHI